MIKTILQHRELLENLVLRDLKGRYKSSVLGFLWSLLIPLFMALIYVFFLRILAGRSVPIAEIIIGVFAWQFTVQCVQNGMTVITSNSNLVKKVFFPRLLLPIASTFANLVNFVLTLLVQFLILGVLVFVLDVDLSVWALTVPLIILHQTLLNLGLAYLLSSCNVYFRDTQHLVGVLLTAWFFMSPAMYNLGLVEAHAGAHPWIIKVYMLNPMASIITAYRAMILDTVQFPWSIWSVIGLVWPLIFWILAYIGFQKAQRNFADML